MPLRRSKRRAMVLTVIAVAAVGLHLYVASGNRILRIETRWTDLTVTTGDHWVAIECWHPPQPKPYAFNVRYYELPLDRLDHTVESMQVYKASLFLLPGVWIMGTSVTRYREWGVMFTLVYTTVPTVVLAMWAWWKVLRYGRRRAVAVAGEALGASGDGSGGAKPQA